MRWNMKLCNPRNPGLKYKYNKQFRYHKEECQMLCSYTEQCDETSFQWKGNMIRQK